MQTLYRIMIVSSLSIMVAIVFFNAVLRYVFNSGFPAGEELARYLFIWICSLGTIVAYKDGRHIGVDLLISNLRGRSLVIVKAIGRVVELSVFVLVLWGGVEYFITSAASPGPATGIPYGYVAASVVVTAAAILGIILKDIIAGRTKGAK
jgi:TRAP-type C4-dicarboxylate transport system permease small subunit